MASDSTISALQRLMVIHYRSLARYLSYASPTWHRGDQRARVALQSIADDHQATADRVGEMLIELGIPLDYGHFPISFTGYHDLGFDFLLQRLIEFQRRDISAIEQCVARLSLNPLARGLAEEAFGAAKGHLETLLELQHPAPESAVH